MNQDLSSGEALKRPSYWYDNAFFHLALLCWFPLELQPLIGIKLFRTTTTLLGSFSDPAELALTVEAEEATLDALEPLRFEGSTADPTR